MTVKIHVEVWIASRVLGGDGRTFSKDELSRFVSDQFGDRRSGVSTHISSYTVAGVKANPGKFRYLTSVGRGVYRVYREGDPTHPTKTDAPTEPNREDIPERFRYLLRSGSSVDSVRVPQPPAATHAVRSNSITLDTEEDVERLVLSLLARAFDGTGDEMTKRIRVGGIAYLVVRQGKVPYHVGTTRVTHKNDLLISDEQGRPRVGIEVVFRSAVTDHFKTRTYDVIHMKREFPSLKGVLVYLKSDRGISPRLAREISYAFDTFFSIPEERAGDRGAWTSLLDTIARWLGGSDERKV